MWRLDFASTRWETEGVRKGERKRERGREGGIENEEMTGRRETAWQTDSQQQPRHLTELSNIMIGSVCVWVFFPLVYHDSWMKINLLLHLPSWVLGSADGPSLSHRASWQPTNSGLSTSSFLSFPISTSSSRLSFFILSPLLSPGLLLVNQMPALKSFFPVLTSPSHSDSRCLGPFEAAIWALITLIDGSEGPCCSSEWQIKAFLDNVGNWLNRL